MLVLLGLVCAAPMIASYFTYYVIKPKGGSTNYGTLIEPQRPIPADLQVTDETGKTVPLSSLRGVWLFVMTDRSACDEACAKKLYFMRQIRVTQAGERHRLTMVWLRSDAGAMPQKVLDAYPTRAGSSPIRPRWPVAGRRRHEGQRPPLHGRSERQPDDAFPEGSEPRQDQGGRDEAAEVVEHRLTQHERH